MQAPPLNAIFSGYSMRPAYFKKLGTALRPDFDDQGIPKHFMEYVSDYTFWRRRLSKEDHARAPLLRILDESDWDETEDTKLFFATRWVPADDGSSKSDYPAMELESDIDRVRRDELIALIERTSGFLVDKNLLQFECIKDIHPFHDPLS